MLAGDVVGAHAAATPTSPSAFRAELVQFRVEALVCGVVEAGLGRVRVVAGVRVARDVLAVRAVVALAIVASVAIVVVASVATVVVAVVRVATSITHHRRLAASARVVRAIVDVDAQDGGGGLVECEDLVGVESPLLLLKDGFVRAFRVDIVDEVVGHALVVQVDVVRGEVVQNRVGDEVAQADEYDHEREVLPDRGVLQLVGDLVLVDRLGVGELLLLLERLGLVGDVGRGLERESAASAGAVGDVAVLLVSRAGLEREGLDARSVRLKHLRRRVVGAQTALDRLLDVNDEVRARDELVDESGIEDDVEGRDDALDARDEVLDADRLTVRVDLGLHLPHSGDVSVHVPSLVVGVVELARAMATADRSAFAEAEVLDPGVQGAAVRLVHVLRVDEFLHVLVAARADGGPDVLAVPLVRLLELVVPEPLAVPGELDCVRRFERGVQTGALFGECELIFVPSFGEWDRGRESLEHGLVSLRWFAGERFEGDGAGFGDRSHVVLVERGEPHVQVVVGRHEFGDVV